MSLTHDQANRVNISVTLTPREYASLETAVAHHEAELASDRGRGREILVLRSALRKIRAGRTDG